MEDIFLFDCITIPSTSYLLQRLTKFLLEWISDNVSDSFRDYGKYYGKLFCK